MVKRMPDSPLDWNQSDAVKLRTYLGESGDKLLKVMRSQGPKIGGATMEERAMTGSERKGWDDAIEFITNRQRDAIATGIDNAGFIGAEEET